MCSRLTDVDELTFFFQGGSDIWWALQANEFKPSLSLLCFCASLPSSLLPSLLSNHCVVVVTLSPPSRLLSVLYISADGWLVFQTARRNECKHAAHDSCFEPWRRDPSIYRWALTPLACFHQITVKNFYFIRLKDHAFLGPFVLLHKEEDKSIFKPWGKQPPLVNALGDAGRGGGG